MHLLVSLLPDFFPLFFLRGGGSRLLLVVDAVVFIIQSTLSPIKRAHDAPDDLYDIVFDIDGWRRSDIGPPLDGMVSKQKQKSNRNGRTDGRWEKGGGDTPVMELPGLSVFVGTHVKQPGRLAGQGESLMTCAQMAL